MGYKPCYTAYRKFIVLFAQLGVFFIVSIVFSCRPTPLYASGPPDDPILRINSEMHTAMIKRLDADRQSHTLLTSSNDKTLRLWNLNSGDLENTLRIPIDRGNDGRIYACALSPDGETVAAGGWTGFNWSGKHSIYLLDPSSGRIKHRISGLPNVIFHLSFSPQGRYLAVTLGRDRGIRIYRTSDWSLLARDSDYGANSYWADFGPQGRLATVSYDGYVRLYNKDFDLLAKEKVPGGDKPFSCAFSPDGKRLAVGFVDSTRVNVVSGRDLKFLYSPNSKGIENGNLASVAWSANGDTVYAGGTHQNGSGCPIFTWKKQGRGKRTILSTSKDTVIDILTLKNGEVIYGSCNPAWGVIDSGTKRICKQPAIPNYRGPNEKDFLVSRDGKTVSFGFDYGYKQPVVFSVEKRGFSSGGNDVQMDPPLLETGSIQVSGWENTAHPRLNGQKLHLQDYETSRSLAVAPEGDRFVLGTQWHVYCFNEKGKRLWKKPVREAWAVNIARDKNVVLASLGDGTVRWYRLEDGKQLLALFPYANGEDWVMWTPQGYYAASPEGDELIGWHKNRGPDKAPDFFPVSRFRSAYYRPDVPRNVLNTLDIDQALKQANKQAGHKKKKVSVEKMLPPVVDILSPRNEADFSSPRITLEYRVRAPNKEKITGIRFMVDGRPVKRQKRSIQVAQKPGSIHSAQIYLPERDCKVSVIAKNRYSASTPASIDLNWNGKKKAGRDEFVAKPKLYLLSIGISNYKKDNLELRYAAQDARDVAGILEKQEGRIYRDVESRVLANAGWGSILDGLEWLEKEVTSNDVAAVFLAGHGYNDRDGDYYFLPANAEPDKLRRTCIPYSMIKDVVSGLPGKTLCFVDTCYSGNVFGNRRRSGMNNINRIVNDLSSAENGVVVFASSTGEQFSVEDKAWKNGAFTEALVEGLSGRADYTGKNTITINELDLYLAERVKELTEGKQTPTTAKPETVPDFPIAVLN